jgi:hypothetical protein
MNPFAITQAIAAYLIQQAQIDTTLLPLQNNLYIQRVPPNASLPYLRLALSDTQPQIYLQHTSDWSGILRLSLVYSLTDGAETLAATHDALLRHLDQKQLISPVQSTLQLIQCWLSSCDQTSIEHDRITQESTWQIRLV